MSLEPKQLKTNFNLWIKKLTSTTDYSFFLNYHVGCKECYLLDLVTLPRVVFGLWKTTTKD